MPADLLKIPEVSTRNAYEWPAYATKTILVAAGAIPVDRLVTDVVPLDDAVGAIGRLAAGDGVVKILVDCR
jgi:threonine dehydrogenase-like Zn-dependent dehydrogenase